jgi:excisionase family DNA binding protein
MEQVEKSTESISTHPRLGDADAAAKVLNVPKSWIYDRTRRDAIPMLRIGKYVRFDLDRLLEWAKAGCPGGHANDEVKN